MEILISVVIGLTIAEIYVWLDPISKRLVKWAADKLPADRQEEFQAQWEADLASTPNSILKLLYVLRDIVWPIDDIVETMFREEFAGLADGADDLVSSMEEKLESLLISSGRAVAQSNAMMLFSRVDQVMRQLQRHRAGEATALIDECLTLQPKVIETYSDYRVAMERGHDLLLDVTESLRDKLQLLVSAQMNIRNRLLSPERLNDADGHLLEALMSALEEVRTASNAVVEIPDRYINITAAILPAIKENGEAFRLALRAAVAAVKARRITAPRTTTLTVDPSPKF